MFDVVLCCPQIPPNTGNIIRLSANTGMCLHLIRPYGFALDDKKLRRSGLDYHDLASIKQHDSLSAYLATIEGRRLFVCSTRGKKRYDQVSYQSGDIFLFGNESLGLSAEHWQMLALRTVLHIPMLPGNRSLNLSNSVAIVLYEAWRQQGFLP
jgi:tRNA (cytidine/uridine-2'-O-)-methyltransferase